MKTPNGKVESTFALLKLDALTQAGFTRTELANLTGIKYVTMNSIIRRRGKFILSEFDEAINRVYNQYQFDRIKSLNEEEAVIDSADAEEGAKEVTTWAIIAVVMFILMLIGLVAVVRFVIGLF